ncbi:MAG: BNR-repeat neuraminidase N-terminal domain-containing protein, partial [Luteolibacter sp.]
MRYTHWIGLALMGAACAADSFENYPAGGFEQLKTELGSWSAPAGQAEIKRGHAKDGNQSLRLTGGGEQAIELNLAQKLDKPGRLSFWAERWTRQSPFLFRIDAAGADGNFKEVWNGDKQIKVGGFLSKIDVQLPNGTARLRIRGNAPANTGVMMDLFSVEEEKPMRLVNVELSQPVVPVLRGKAINPVLGMRVTTEGALQPLSLEAVEVALDGTSRPADVAELSLVPGNQDPSGGFGDAFGSPLRGSKGAISGKSELSAGDNWFWVSVRLKDQANIDGRVDAAISRVKISGK